MEQPGRLVQLGISAALGCAMLSFWLANLGEAGRAELGQLVAVTLFAATVAVWAYLTGEQLPSGWGPMLHAVGWTELFRFWWWPGLAFAATYYLTLAGVATFLFRLETM